MNLSERISHDIKSAMRESNQQELSTLRLVHSALQNAAIASKKKLSDDDVVSVLQKESKKRSDAAEVYKKGDRPELAEKELQELEIIKRYLPEQMSHEDVGAVVEEVIAASEEKPGFGQVMKAVMEKVRGKADGKLVSSIVKEKLS
ncbi:GatB/YqeY domain-containing protein [Patescibacteria group bacterium]